MLQTMKKPPSAEQVLGVVFVIAAMLLTLWFVARPLMLDAFSRFIPLP